MAISFYFSVRLFVCRQRIMMAAGACPVGHSGCNDLLETLKYLRNVARIFIRGIPPPFPFLSFSLPSHPHRRRLRGDDGGDRSRSQNSAVTREVAPVNESRGRSPRGLAQSSRIFVEPKPTNIRAESSRAKKKDYAII